MGDSRHIRTEPFEGADSEPLAVFQWIVKIVLGAYFKVAPRARKARVGLEPCVALAHSCVALNTLTLNALAMIALEGTELTFRGSIPRRPILSAEEGCVDTRYIHYRSCLGI